MKPKVMTAIKIGTAVVSAAVSVANVFMHKHEVDAAAAKAVAKALADSKKGES